MIVFFCPLNGFSQNPKVVDLTDIVTAKRLKSKAWCVYTCFEALGASPQCEGCEYYILNYIVNRYNNYDNPYGSLIPDYFQIMVDFVSHTTSPCSNSFDYEELGVIFNDLGSYFDTTLGYIDVVNMVCDSSIADVQPVF